MLIMVLLQSPQIPFLKPQMMQAEMGQVIQQIAHSLSCEEYYLELIIAREDQGVNSVVPQNKEQDGDLWREDQSVSKLGGEVTGPWESCGELHAT